MNGLFSFGQVVPTQFAPQGIKLVVALWVQYVIGFGDGAYPHDVAHEHIINELRVKAHYGTTAFIEFNVDDTA